MAKFTNEWLSTQFTRLFVQEVLSIACQVVVCKEDSIEPEVSAYNSLDLFFYYSNYVFLDCCLYSLEKQEPCSIVFIIQEVYIYCGLDSKLF